METLALLQASCSASSIKGYSRMQLLFLLNATLLSVSTVATMFKCGTNVVVIVFVDKFRLWRQRRNALNTKIPITKMNQHTGIC